MGNLKTIHRLLIESGRTVAAAESCTGGLLCASLTSLPGSSAYFILGLVVYSNRSKTKLLGISPRLIILKGAVSEPVCREMASSVRATAKTDYGIGITGIAGPAGAGKGKPVGTVYIAVSSASGTACRRYVFSGSRGLIRSRARDTALRMLLAAIRKRKR